MVDLHLATFNSFEFMPPSNDSRRPTDGIFSDGHFIIPDHSMNSIVTNPNMKSTKNIQHPFSPSLSLSPSMNKPTLPSHSLKPTPSPDSDSNINRNPSSPPPPPPPAAVAQYSLERSPICCGKQALKKMVKKLMPLCLRNLGSQTASSRSYPASPMGGSSPISSTCVDGREKAIQEAINYCKSTLASPDGSPLRDIQQSDV